MRTASENKWRVKFKRRTVCHSGPNEARFVEFNFDGKINPVESFFTEQPKLLREPTRREQLEAETELFGFAVSGHPLELFPKIAWDTYCPVAELGKINVMCRFDHAFQRTTTPAHCKFFNCSRVKEIWFKFVFRHDAVKRSGQGKSAWIRKALLSAAGSDKSAS
jgi:hypothetical protein